MNGLRVWIILAWIALPTVMFGGYSPLQLIDRGNVLTASQIGWLTTIGAAPLVIAIGVLVYGLSVR